MALIGLLMARLSQAGMYSIAFFLYYSTKTKNLRVSRQTRESQCDHRVIIIDPSNERRRFEELTSIDKYFFDHFDEYTVTKNPPKMAHFNFLSIM